MCIGILDKNRLVLVYNFAKSANKIEICSKRKLKIYRL